jgi:hypothetical protein
MKRLVILLCLSIFTFSFANEAIDEEIARLEKKLHDYKIKEMNAEIKGQNEMLLDWQDFDSDMKEAENYENEIEKIQTRLDALRKQKESKR